MATLIKMLNGRMTQNSIEAGYKVLVEMEKPSILEGTFKPRLLICNCIG